MSTILHTESSMGWGGQEIRILQESLGMIRRGHRVVIAAPEQSRIFAKAGESGVPAFPVTFQKKNPLSVLAAASLITRERPAIVNTHSSSDSWVATIAAKLSPARPKIIRTKHLSAPVSRSLFSKLIYDILPDAVMTTGEEIRRRMITDNRFDAAKISSVPTGIDLQRFNPEKVRPAFRPDGFSIGMIGVLRSWKGHAVLIEAAPEIANLIPGACFYIAGAGPQQRHLEELLRKSPVRNRIFMLGHRDDVPEIMASLDIIVHPSYANEGVPQSILQALAMERPVVASDTGAIKEAVIDGTTGFLIEPRNPEQLAQRVIDLYKSPGLRTAFGQSGRRLVEKSYSLEHMLDKVELLYGRLLDNA